MLNDNELIAAIEGEESLCLDSRSGELQAERTDALDRYRGVLLGNEVAGRSQVVDKSVLDTIEWIMPSLVRIYMGSDDIGKFEARGKEDEAAAQQETEVCNWYLQSKNDAFSHINATLRDALLLKNGYIVAFWRRRVDTMTEAYKGLSDEELAVMMQDPEITVVEHSDYPDPMAPIQQPAAPMPMAAPQQAQQPQQPPMLHDVRLERKTAEEYVQIESVPPDELLISRRHRWTSLGDVDFVQWRRRVSIGELRAEGFNVPDDEPQDEEFSQEWVARQRFNETFDVHDETPDPARRIVLCKDTYMRIDLRGSGTPQLWRFVFINGSRDLLLKEQADVVPFAAFTPIVYPHSHIGSSVYDLINDLSVIKTTLLRQYLDGVYLANSGEKAVNTDNVNLDDLLVSRPGNIIRVTGSPSENIMPLVSADVTQSVLAGLEYIDSVKEARTGVTRYSAGLDANTLNKTATGVQQIQAAANQRIELIGRTLASGFRDLFLIIHALAQKHSTKPLSIKLRNNWVTVNPREWTRRTDFIVSVGLGTGTPEAQMQKLMALAPFMQQAMGMGLAGPQEMYNYAVEILKAAGYRNPDRFIHAPPIDPQTGQPKQPQPPPNPMAEAEQVKGQVTMQVAQMKGQSDMALKQQEMQFQAQLEAVKAQKEQAVQQAQMQADVETALAKHRMQLDLDNIKHQREQDVAIQLANIEAAAKIEVAKITKGAMGIMPPEPTWATAQ